MEENFAAIWCFKKEVHNLNNYNIKDYIGPYKTHSERGLILVGKISYVGALKCSVHFILEVQFHQLVTEVIIEKR